MFFFSRAEYAPGTKGEVPVETVSSLKADAYRMDHPNRGLAVIINNKDFLPHTNMGTRTGTDQDKINITNRLRILGFSTEPRDNLTIEEMKDLMKKGRFAYFLHVGERVCFLI